MKQIKSCQIDRALEKSYTIKDKICAYANPLIYYLIATPGFFFQFIFFYLLSNILRKEVLSTEELDCRDYPQDEEQSLIADQDRLEFLKPITLTNGKVIRNRIVKAGITDGLSNSKGNPSEESIFLYKKYAQGKYGMIISPATSIERKSKVSSFGNSPVLDQNSDREAFQEFAKAIKEKGAYAILQLTHPGPLVNPNQEAVAPSHFISKSPYNIYPRRCNVLSTDEIEKIIEKFVISAQLAEKCGFDGIQIVAANGYLASSFLSKNINKRKDKWRGDTFVVELMKRLIESRTRPDFIIGIKINSSDLQEGGLTQEESLETIKKLNELKIDFIEIGGGTYQNMDTRYSVNNITSHSSYKRESFFIDFAERLTQMKELTVPFITVGGWTDVKSMIDCLKNNPNMMIGFGRATCLDPYLGKHLIETRMTKLPEKFKEIMPDWIKKMAESDNRETRRAAFGLESAWYAFAASYIARGYEIPKIKGLFENPLSALAFKIFLTFKGIIPNRLKMNFFQNHPIMMIPKKEIVNR